MGYRGHVTYDIVDVLDLKSDFEKTIGKKIKLSFYPNSKEEYYMLENVKIGLDIKGLYIHFFLESNGEKIEFILNGIKDFEYNIFDTFTKYWLSPSNDPLNVPEGDGSVAVQYGNEECRVFLYK